MVISSFCMIKSKISMFFKALFIRILHKSQDSFLHFVHKASEILALAIKITL